MNATETRIPKLLTTAQIGEHYLGRDGRSGRHAAWKLLKRLSARGLKPVESISTETHHYYRRADLDRLLGLAS
jgi:hypothetical protein